MTYLVKNKVLLILQFIRTVCFTKQCAYDLSDIRLDYDTPPRDLLRADRLPMIHARIRRPRIRRRHAPERVLDNAGGVIPIAHQKS